MILKNVTGNLLAYKQLEPGTFLHVDQLTTERRTNHRLRNQSFYTADGEMYAVEGTKHLWVITREPQNLVLQNIDEAYRQLTDQRNYFPDTKLARDSVAHSDSVVVNLEGLKLVKNDDQYGYFVVDPRNVKRLNSEQRKAAQRIYGPDKENFGLNLEMFAEAEKTLFVFVLMPEYVQGTLKSNDKRIFGRASWLGDFYHDSYFNAFVRGVDYPGALHGVCRENVARSTAVPESRASRAPQETEKVRSLTMEEILTTSLPHTLKLRWKRLKAEIGKLYKQ